MHRRTFLTTASATIVAATTAGSSSASASSDAPERPDHITEVRDDLEELERYQPRLVMGLDAREDISGMYGWIAESDEYDVTAYYYWTRYVTQRSLLYWFGVDWGPEDHYLDHEPCVVFVNDDGTVEKVVYTAGHHYAGEVAGDDANLTESRVDGLETHVNLTVVRPHNHYMHSVDRDGIWIQPFAEFGSFEDVREEWHRAGRFDSTADEALTDPFAFLEDRHHWWHDDTRDAWFARNVWIRFGLREGASRDPLMRS